MLKTPLILVSNQTRPISYDHYENMGDVPRQDIVEICRRLGGTIAGMGLLHFVWLGLMVGAKTMLNREDLREATQPISARFLRWKSCGQ